MYNPVFTAYERNTKTDKEKVIRISLDEIDLFEALCKRYNLNDEQAETLWECRMLDLKDGKSIAYGYEEMNEWLDKLEV